ncbi:TetR/AcrR family transcriptional regulator [Bhargavaea beijingensis]|uniref:TetR/AcrR family transcriptional regulator n=1 Tax=Bhargavaea beijingensis TaxID=426756 RepID=A0A1G7D430_9BACL|nr:TetR/AcrR family transcriptional regulator [Bhargavaea beijingensis]MCW1929231.1 TetR family transcriptional regulator [Bhargavaea beijingensis]RSK24449.1 TetR/AcrR family transcriptional regulator [Bhargavaea beijingensis]SDE46251.1 transcriptional regulator, TetR family [Bhargavaea beijingensis]
MNRNKPKYGQIVDAAVIAIAENGYHQAQVSKIAKQAGVADGTIYLYFKNKEDILVSVFREKMALFMDNLRPVMEDSEMSSEEKLYRMIDNHFNVLYADRHLAIVTQLELRQSNKELRLKINEVLKDYLAMLDRILQEGIERGEFEKSMDIRLARQMVFGTVDEISTSWVMNDQKYDLIKLAPDVHRLLMKGMKAT